MADIIVRQDGQVPLSMKIRYKDMGDGTHALAVASCASPNPGSLPIDLVVGGTLKVETTHPDPDPNSGKPTVPVSFNIALRDKNTEYTLVLPEGTWRFEIQCRTRKGVRFAFEPGKVASRKAPYHTLQAGDYYVSPPLAQVKVLYFATSAQNVVVEVLAWVV